MPKAIGLAVVVVGIIVLICGIHASETIGSQAKEAVRGTPSDKSIWMIVSGAVVAILGLATLTRSGRTRPAA
jgi:protein-S-isoprenylcysteine O-methyltransferase Ste14